MKKYIGIKQVKAEPMTIDEANKKSLIAVGEKLSKKELSINGYHIKHDNGIESWIPKDEFEKTYYEGTIEDVSDGYHTFKELYHYRMLYNAAFFNELAKSGKIKTCKSYRHHNGEKCFGGGWFIVMAELPNGQISNHYENKDWDLFKIPELEIAFEWDGHTNNDVADRIKEYLSIMDK